MITTNIVTVAPSEDLASQILQEQLQQIFNSSLNFNDAQSLPQSLPRSLQRVFLVHQALVGQLSCVWDTDKPYSWALIENVDKPKFRGNDRKQTLFSLYKRFHYSASPQSNNQSILLQRFQSALDLNILTFIAQHDNFAKLTELDGTRTANNVNLNSSEENSVEEYFTPSTFAEGEPFSVALAQFCKDLTAQIVDIQSFYDFCSDQQLRDDLSQRANQAASFFRGEVELYSTNQLISQYHLFDLFFEEENPNMTTVSGL